MIFSEIPLVFINEINTLIFNFLWNGRDKIKRETLYQDFSKGGLNVPSLIQKQDSLIIQTLRRIEINRNQLGLIYTFIGSETILNFIVLNMLQIIICIILKILKKIRI